MPARAGRGVPGAGHRGDSGGRSSSIRRAGCSTRGSSEPPRLRSPAPRRGRGASRTRAEAWFYLAGAYAPLVQWRVLRGERLAAAREGKKIKDALERALALDPTLQDAYFGIGLYHYYADVAPAALKIAALAAAAAGRRSRARACGRCCRRATAASCSRGEADYQLHWLYLWYEQTAGGGAGAAAGSRRALSVESDLPPADRRGRSTNTSTIIAGAAARGRRCWRGRARRRSAPHASPKCGRDSDSPRSSSKRREPDRAIGHLTAVIALQPTAPYSALALAQLQLGEAYDRLGRRDLRERCVSAPRSRSCRSAIRRASARVRARDCATRRMPNDLFFDNLVAFVLDIRFLTTIIYIWYEGGELRPSLVRLESSTSPFRLAQPEGPGDGGRCQEATSAEIG